MTMPSRLLVEDVPAEDDTVKSVVKLLGGKRVLRKTVATPLDAHDLILNGLPSAALLHLADTIVGLQVEQVLRRAIGVSIRTLQRRKENPQPLSEEQGGRTWNFAEVL